MSQFYPLVLKTQQFIQKYKKDLTLTITSKHLFQTTSHLQKERIINNYHLFGRSTSCSGKKYSYEDMIRDLTHWAAGEIYAHPKNKRNILLTVESIRTDFSNNSEKLFLAGMDLFSLPIKVIQNMKNLKFLDISYNNISRLSLDGLPQLKELNASYNLLTKVYLKDLLNCTEVCLGNNKIHSLIIENLPCIEVLYAPNNQLDEIILENLLALTFVYLSLNNLSYLNFNNLPSLKEFDVSRNNLLKVDILNLPKLEKFNISHNQVKKLIVDNFPELVSVYADFNPCFKPDITKNPKLTILSVLFSGLSNDETAKILARNNSEE